MPHGDYAACDGHHHSHHHHGHQQHGHHHHPAPPADFSAAFAIGTALNAAFVVTEAVFGVMAHSMALLSDAAHNLGDVLGLALAWGAAALSARRPSRQHTYGFGRSSILAALINAAVLLVGIGGIALAALQRLIWPQPVGGITVMVVAAIGIAANGFTAMLFHRGRQGDLNIRATFLHMAMDALVSLGVVATGLLVMVTGWMRLDPLVSLAIAAALLASCWRLLRQSVQMALDAVPGSVDRDAVEAHLRAQPGVRAVHDLHIWSLSTSDVALTAHLVRPDGADDAFLSTLCAEMRHRFGIGHATFQLEQGDPAYPCTLAPADVV